MWRSPACRLLRGGAEGRRALISVPLTLGLTIGWVAAQPQAQGIPLPPGKDVGLVVSRCIICHSLEMVAQQRQDLAGWQAIVDRMIEYGAPISAEERQVILNYLVTALGP
jgi:hypothetical protein